MGPWESQGMTTPSPFGPGPALPLPRAWPPRPAAGSPTGPFRQGPGPSPRPSTHPLCPQRRSARSPGRKALPCPAARPERGPAAALVGTGWGRGRGAAAAGPPAPSGHTAGSPSLGGRSGPGAAQGPRPEAWRGLCDVTEGTRSAPPLRRGRGQGGPGECAPGRVG